MPRINLSNLSGAYLGGVNLEGALLDGTNLSGAYIPGVKYCSGTLQFV